MLWREKEPTEKGTAVESSQEEENMFLILMRNKTNNSDKEV